MPVGDVIFRHVKISARLNFGHYFGLAHCLCHGQRIPGTRCAGGVDVDSEEGHIAFPRFKNLKELPVWKFEIVGEWEGVFCLSFQVGLVCCHALSQGGPFFRCLPLAIQLTNLKKTFTTINNEFHLN